MKALLYAAFAAVFVLAHVPAGAQEKKAAPPKESATATDAKKDEAKSDAKTDDAKKDATKKKRKGGC